MKKLLSLIVTGILFIQCLSAQPGSFSEPLTAVEGTNVSIFNTTNYLYYRYVMPCDGKLTFTSQSNDDIVIDIYSTEDYLLASLDLDSYESGVNAFNKNDTLILRVDGDNRLISWNLSVSSGIEPGSAYFNALEAKQGLNNADNSKGNQWFVFTPEKDGILDISTCGLTEEDTYIYLYDTIDYVIERSDDDCGYQTHITQRVEAGNNYYIEWVNQYTSSTFNWNLTFSDLKSGSDVINFTLKDGSQKSLLSREPEINTSDHSIVAYVSKNTDLNNSIYAYFSLSEGASIKIGENELSSSYDLYVNNNIFKDTTITYTITSEDSENTQDWKVTILNESDLATGNSFEYFTIDYDTATIDETAHTISIYKNGNNYLTTFKSSPLSRIYQNSMEMFENSPYFLSYSDTLTFSVISESGVTQDWKVFLTQEINCEDAISVNEGITYGNGDYNQIFSFTPSNSSIISISSSEGYPYFEVYTGTCNDLEYVNNGGYDIFFAAAKDSTYFISASRLYHNDLVIQSISTIKKEIAYFETYSDYYDQYDEAEIDTVKNTINVSVGFRTDLSNIEYEFEYFNYDIINVSVGDSSISSDDYGDYSKPVVYTLTAIDSSVANYTVTITKRPAIASEFYAYGLINQMGDAVIDPNSHTITIGIDTTGGLDITSLTPMFDISRGAYLTDKDSVLQESNSTTRDFSDTVKYDFYGDDYSVERWNVIPLLGDSAVNNQTDIVSFHFFVENEVITIDKVNSTISVNLPYTDVSNMTSWFTLSRGANATINSAGQVSGVTKNNFTSSVIYTVTAEDGSTRNWTVNVSSLNSEANIMTFSIAGQTNSSVNNTNHTITVDMPAGTDASNLVSTFTLSDQATARVVDIVQVSGTTANNFSNDVHYVVSAGDGTKLDWTISVSVAVANSDNFANNSMVAYPNPNDGNFTLKLNNEYSTTANLSIVSLDGRCILQKELYLDGITTETLNLNVASGTYIVRIVSGNTINNQCIQIIR